MKNTLSSVFGLAVLASVSLVSPASALSWAPIVYVPVGNAGNAADPETGSLYGAVAYNYQIAKNETTIGQYTEFLNAVATKDPYHLYSTNMEIEATIAGISRSGVDGLYSYSVVGDSGNKPITYVSWFDAARFCNWLHNGQGGGSTETGAYTLDNAMTGIFTVNPGAKIWIPSENEWYKAAYYDAAKGGTGGYWPYPTQSNALNGNTVGNANSANYDDGDYVGSGSSAFPTSNALTDVGAYGENSDSFYGTNDQAGNVWEWNDAVVSGSSRGLRGGSWYGYGFGIGQDSSFRDYFDPSTEDYDYGFRVASAAVVAVPEPTSLLSTLAFVSSGLLLRRRGKISH